MTAPAPRPDPRTLRRRLLAREPVIGSFLKFPGPQSTEIFGSVGYDFVILDEEHAPWTREQLGTGYLAARASGTAAITRIARADAASILAALDDGATGVMVPHVATPEKAREIATWTRYVGGTRGSGLGRAADYGGRLGAGGIETYYEEADQVSTLIAMIEDADAIGRIDEIAAVEGIDAFFIGRGDLALSLANTAGPAPTLAEATKRIAEGVIGAGKVLAAVSPSLASDDARQMMELGVTCMLASNDQAFLRAGATAQLDNFRSLYGLA